MASQIDQLCRFGNPINHESKIPIFATLFATNPTVHDLYRARWCQWMGLLRAAKHFFAGGRGCNVTVPFKEEAYRFADRLTDARV